MLDEDEPAPRHGMQKGEIKSHLYPALGFGFRRLVQLDRFLFRLGEEKGVLISSVKTNTPAKKAGLARRDIITAVNGVNTPDVAAFQRAFEKNLLAHKKAIILSVQKRNISFDTAIAPHYDLKGKKVLLIAPDSGVEHLDIIRRELIVSGADLVYANPAGQSPGKGFNLTEIIALSKAEAKSFNAVLFIGGSGAKTLWSNK